MLMVHVFLSIVCLWILAYGPLRGAFFFIAKKKQKSSRIQGGDFSIVPGLWTQCLVVSS